MKVFSATDIGQKRQMNQDYIYTSVEPVGNLPNLFVVADGMGGHNAGDFASRCSVSVLVDTVKKDKNFNPLRSSAAALRRRTGKFWLSPGRMKPWREWVLPWWRPRWWEDTPM